jgi:hypothetical protein
MCSFRSGALSFYAERERKGKLLLRFRKNERRHSAAWALRLK